MLLEIHSSDAHFTLTVHQKETERNRDTLYFIWSINMKGEKHECNPEIMEKEIFLVFSHTIYAPFQVIYLSSEDRILYFPKQIRGKFNGRINKNQLIYKHNSFLHNYCNNKILLICTLLETSNYYCFL